MYEIQFHEMLENFLALVVCACCFMQNDCWRHISTISVNYIQGKPYYAYLSGLDAHSSSYIFGDVSPMILIW